MKNLIKLHRLVLCLLVISFFISSCSKTSNELEPNFSNTEELKKEINVYSIDGKEVSAEHFKWDQKDYFYHINIGEKNNPNSENVYSMAFSSKEAYDAFMYEELGEKHALHEKAIEHLRTYAVTSGAVTSFDETGKIPQFYLDYEKEFLMKEFPDEFNSAQERGLVAVLFKNLFCNNAFNITLPLLGTPFFIFNNNEASSMEGLLIGGHHKAFDRSFYRRQLFSLTVWGFNCINFPPLVDDRTSSWWSIGV